MGIIIIAVLVVISGYNDWRILMENINSLKNIFRRTGSKICNQLIVDRQIGSNYHKVIDIACFVQIGDKRPHQSGFADTGCKSEAKRHEFPVKLFDRWILC